MLARSNVVLEGYWENPEETARVLEGGWFHTGDGGVIGDDGYLTIQDRKKDVIITGGENVSSIEVEDAIFSHPDVAEVAVIGVPDEKWGETIKALVVKAEGSALTEEELIDYVKGKVARYKAPSSVEFREALDSHRDRQAAEVQAAGAVLGRPRPAGQLAPTVGRLVAPYAPGMNLRRTAVCPPSPACPCSPPASASAWRSRPAPPPIRSWS